MSVKSSVIAAMLISAMIAPVTCLAQGGAGGGGGGGAAGGGASGSGSSGSGASGAGSAGSGTSTNPGNAAGAGAPGPTGKGTSSSPVPATNPAGTARAGRQELPPAPAENSNMTWDGNRLRPNDRRQSHPVYPRSRTALTPFDVHPFAGTFRYGYDGYYDPGCCLYRQPR